MSRRVCVWGGKCRQMCGRRVRVLRAVQLHAAWLPPCRPAFPPACRAQGCEHTWLLLPAVVVPSFLNTVRSDARLAAVAPGRMPSSAVTTTCSAVRRSSAVVRGWVLWARHKR